MKKSLVALAVLGAFAGSAFAADVTLYGLVDYGFNYTHKDSDVPGADAKDQFEMRAGQNSGSRFGLRGTEDLGNGLKVGFVLENGFAADSGALTTAGKIFDREAHAYVEGAFGKVGFGRLGQLASANGTYGLLGRFSPFSSGWGDTIGQRTVMANGYSRMDNMISYVTPDFAGFKVYAQYSFKNADAGKGDENKTTADRYYAIGATFDAGNFAAVAIVDSINMGKNGTYFNEEALDDPMTVTLGATYDFGVVKLFASGQYFDNVREVGYKGSFRMSKGSNVWGYGTQVRTLDDADKTVKVFGSNMNGFGIAVGASTPVLGGTLSGLVGYMDADNDGGVANTNNTLKENAFDVKRWNVAVGYSYNLSKRTSLYAGAAYTKDAVKVSQVNRTKNAVVADVDPSSIEVLGGMIHRF